MTTEPINEPHKFSNRKEVREEIKALAANGEGPQPPPAVPPTLNQKILAIQKKIGTVKKRGFNKEHSYKFLQIEDAVLAVKKLMEEQGLLLSATTAKRPDGLFYSERTTHPTKGYINSIMLCWTLLDVETGEGDQWFIPGEGYDTTDKGLPKAITASRKQALILIFNIPVGDNPEANSASVERGAAKQAAQATGEKKISEMAAAGNKSAVDALSQIEPEKKIKLGRPEEHQGNYIVVSGFIAAPQLERFFDDTGSKRFKTKTDLVPYWRVPSEYEKGLLLLCEKLGIEVEG